MWGGDERYKSETRELDKEAQCCMYLATSVLFAINHMETLKVNGREKPTTSYRWTGWVWEEKNELKFKTSGKLRIGLEESMEYA